MFGTRKRPWTVSMRSCCRADFPTAIISAAVLSLGLPPGALVRNRSLHFVCDMVTTRVEVADSLFTHGCGEGTLLRLPVAHGEGCFFADEATLRALNERRQIILRYATADGRISHE